MSLKELWQLFPIFLVEHKEEWEDWYEEEKNGFYTCFQVKVSKVFPILAAQLFLTFGLKKFVDILLEVPEKEDLQDFKKRLLDAGYLLMSEGEKRLSFNKGYTKTALPRKYFTFIYVIKG